MHFSDVRLVDFTVAVCPNFETELLSEIGDADWSSVTAEIYVTSSNNFFRLSCRPCIRA